MLTSPTPRSVVFVVVRNGHYCSRPQLASCRRRSGSSGLLCGEGSQNQQRSLTVTTTLIRLSQQNRHHQQKRFVDNYDPICLTLTRRTLSTVSPSPSSSTSTFLTSEMTARATKTVWSNRRRYAAQATAAAAVVAATTAMAATGWFTWSNTDNDDENKISRSSPASALVTGNYRKCQSRLKYFDYPQPFKLTSSAAGVALPSLFYDVFAAIHQNTLKMPTMAEPLQQQEEKQTTTTSKRGRTAANQPRNVMISRMRSVAGRGLNDKYHVDWNTVLGEGAYGSVHPARLALTGEKVISLYWGFDLL